MATGSPARPLNSLSFTKVCAFLSDIKLRAIPFMPAGAETPAIVGVPGIDVVHMNLVRVFR